MEWSDPATTDPWTKPIEHLEEKRRAAGRLVGRLRDGDVVGVGSGSTSYLTLCALVEEARRHDWDFSAVTTSIEMAEVCARLGVDTLSLLQRRPDWSFDGADEVDGGANMIKGRGGAMLRERLVMTSSPERYVVVDATKLVARLGATHPVPVEVVPESLRVVEDALGRIEGVDDFVTRTALAKDGPVITEHGNLILDVRFSKIGEGLGATLDAVAGIVATGLFVGFHPTIITEHA